MYAHNFATMGIGHDQEAMKKSEPSGYYGGTTSGNLDRTSEGTTLKEAKRKAEEDESHQ